jgi:hypothetical protein
MNNKKILLMNLTKHFKLGEFMEKLKIH